MRRTLITLVAAMLVAAGANAATISVDTDQASYNLGDSIIITVTVDVTDPAGDTLNFFGGYGLQVGWDPSIVAVSNAATDNPPFGTSSQNPVLAGLDGSPNPLCSNSGDVCTIVTQTNGAFTPVVVPQGTMIIGTLAMTANAIGGLGLSISNYLNITDSDPANAIVGDNFRDATVVPEPGTAGLMGLGLMALGVVGRRRG